MPDLFAAPLADAIESADWEELEISAVVGVPVPLVLVAKRIAERGGKVLVDIDQLFQAVYAHKLIDVLVGIGVGCRILIPHLGD